MPGDGRSGIEIPLVSVIVPAYNAARYLRESVDSILAQTYPNTEIFVLDDASTDGTAAIIASYGDRIRSYRQPVNRGIYGNMNDGIAKVKGEYVAVYHADDVYDPRIVEREVEYLEAHADVGAVFTKDRFIDPEGRSAGRLELPEEVQGGRPLDYAAVVNTLLTYKNHFLRCPSCMVRSDVYRAVGGYDDEAFRNTSDLEMYLRISRRYKVAVLDECLYAYRWGHGNSGQRYRRLRTDPNRFFAIMDLCLRERGGGKVATGEARREYEAHRSEDNLMRAVNLYILGQPDEARDVIGQIRISRILRSRCVVRWRLLVLLEALSLLVRLPRVGWAAALFHWRWHSRSRLRRPFGWHNVKSVFRGLRRRAGARSGETALNGETPIGVE